MLTQIRSLKMVHLFTAAAIGLAALVIVRPLKSKEGAFPPDAIRHWESYSNNAVKLLRLRGKSFEGDDEEVIYKANGDSRILVWEKKRGGEWTGEVWGRNDKYNFSLTRRGRSQPWVLTFIALKDRHDDGSTVDQVLRANDGDYQHYALGLRRYPVNTLAKLMSFRAESVQPDEHTGSIQWVAFTVNANEPIDGDNTAFFHKGRIALDTAHAWLPVQAELHCSTAVVRCAKSEFRCENGRWYPARTKFVTTSLKTGKAHHSDEEVLEINTYDAPPPNDFFLASFGLPEPSARITSVPPFAWLVLLGFGLLVTGLYVRQKWASHNG